MRPPRRHATRATVLLAGLGLAACSGTADKDDTAQEARQAIADKTDENIALAQEYIDKGGEYTRAIEIFEQFLLADPGNEKLLAAKARAEEMRYMTLDRFAKVTKGMTEEQVRELLGTPKRTNVREFDRGVIGWFYAKEEPQTAAGVFFRSKQGVLTVYQTNFDAITR